MDASVHAVVITGCEGILPPVTTLRISGREPLKTALGLLPVWLSLKA